MSRHVLDLMQLTPREGEVLRLVACGLSAKEAALELHIAPCTVERHVENVRLKTRTRNRAHMIAYVIQEGLLPERTAERTLALVAN
jgi:LuxR family transcriptional regulator, transcriptional regulator of spore coat protein